VKLAQIFINPKKPDADSIAASAGDQLRDGGFQVSFETDIPHEKLGKADLILTFGGDGSVLRAVGFAAPHGSPVMGIHLGRFGFLTCCQPSDMPDMLGRVIQGDFHVDDRMMVRASVVRGGKELPPAHGLNEVALQRGVSAKMMTFDITIDDNYVTTYPADGILISTPTGSTAYNLSAGGPVASPNLEALLLTPILPHTLGARPIVLAPESVVRLKVGSPGESLLVADGEAQATLVHDDEIVVRRSEYVARLVLPSKNDFYDRLRGRLLWGART
jgi:NAD+ kinase